jgi:hypothetical protein
VVPRLVMRSPVPRKSPVSIGVPRDWVVSNYKLTRELVGAALDMVGGRTLACVFRKSFAKTGAVSPTFPPTLTPTLPHPIPTTTTFQSFTLVIARKCPCMLSTLYSGLNTHKKAPDAV